MNGTGTVARGGDKSEDDDPHFTVQQEPDGRKLYVFDLISELAY